MQVPYYSLANDLDAFKDLDRQIRETIGGIFRRLGKKMDGPQKLNRRFLGRGSTRRITNPQGKKL